MAKDIEIKVKFDAKAAKKQMSALEKEMKDLNKKRAEGIKLTEVEEEQLKKLNKEYSKLNSNLEETGDASGKSVGGLKKLGTAMKALVANPIGLFLALLAGTLVAIKSAFTSTEEGANKFGQGLAFLRGFIQPLIEVAKQMGEVIVEAIENPSKAWNNFKDTLQNGWNFMKQNVIEPLKAGFSLTGQLIQRDILNMRIAWNDFTGDDEEVKRLTDALKVLDEKIIENKDIILNAGAAIKKVTTDAFDSVVASVNATVSAGIVQGKLFLQLEKDNQALLKSRRALETSNAKILAQIEEEKNIRDVESNTLQERIDANNRIAELELKRSAANLKQSKAELANLRREIQLKGASTDLLNAQAEKEREIFELQGESAGIRNEQLVNEVGLRREAVEKLNAEIDASNELAQITIKNEREKLEATIAANEAKLQNFRDLNLTQTQEFRDAVNELKTAEAELDVFTEESAKRRAEIRVDAMREGFDKERAERQLQFNQEIEDLRIHLENEDITEAEFNAIRLEKEKKLQEDLGKIREAQIQGAIQDIQNVVSQIDAFTDAIADARTTKANNELDARKGRLDEETAAVKAQLEAEGNFTEEELQRRTQAERDSVIAQEKIVEEIARREFERQKKLNIVGALINGASAIVKAIATFGPPPSPAGIAGIASAVAITAAQVAAIGSTEFEGGGSSVSAPVTSVPTVPQSSINPVAFLGDSNQETFGGGQGANQQAPIRAFVVERDISSSQERQLSLEAQSTIG